MCYYFLTENIPFQSDERKAIILSRYLQLKDSITRDMENQGIETNDIIITINDINGLLNMKVNNDKGEVLYSVSHKSHK
mgnify:CR=1 FL=1